MPVPTVIITRFLATHAKLLVVSLGERRDRRVVVDEHRNPEPLPQHLANRGIDERYVDGRDHPSGLEPHH